MKQVGTADLKAHLSAYLRAVQAGESITVLDRTRPVARLVPVEDGQDELIVRPARGSLTDLEIPTPAGGTGDVMDDLLAERGERL